MLVRIRGLEPPLPCENQNLNLARLPIPPYPHSSKSSQISSQPIAQNQKTSRIMGHSIMPTLEPESSSIPSLEPPRAQIDPENSNDGDSRAPSGQENVTKVSQAEEHRAITRLTNFLISQVFVRRRSQGTHEWATCWRLAVRIRAGFIKMERIKIPTPEYPSTEVLRAIPVAWGYASNESDDHRWLKFAAMDFAKTIGVPNVEYEVPYGPCRGDVVGGLVIECGDTDPARVECIYDKPLFFVSLPYCDRLRNAQLHAFMFSMTEPGLDQCFISPWSLREHLWLRRCDEIFGPMFAASPQVSA